MTHDVFVSYSSKDKTVADSIVAALESNNIRCWYAPRDIKPSDDWGKAITNAILNSKLLLIIFSGNANHSQRVLDELNFAISKEITILPFRIENLEPIGAMGLHLSSRHWLDAYNPSWEPFLEKLIKNVSVIVDANLIEEDIKLPESIGKQFEGRKKKKVTWIFAAIVSTAVLILAGWYGYKALIPSQADNELQLETSASEIPFETITTEPEEDFALKERTAELNVAFPEGDLDLDPQIFASNAAYTLDENIFLSLAKIDGENSDVVPEAAENWSISLDGTLYTFNIRQDIPWVTHSLNGETVQVLDENENPRYVTANDFVFAIHRTCDPNFVGDFGLMFIPLIKGCKEVNEYEDPQNIPEELFEKIGARAVSDSELLIELTEPSSYFLSMTTLNHLSPLPEWAVEKYGNAWKNPGLIPTNGYYVIDKIEQGESITLVRNSLLPEDLNGEGNIGTINISTNTSNEESYDLWKKQEVDFSPIPDLDYSQHIETYPDETLSQSNQLIYYFQLNTTKPPFNNVHVRRAFAAALDKKFLLENTIFENGFQTDHLVLPGNIGSPNIDEEDILYDLTIAKNELAEAGYPNCEGFPEVNFYRYVSSMPFSDQILRIWENNLGCQENTININQDFQGDENTDIIFAGWGIDYPDQYNLYENIIYCESPVDINFKRECDEIDELITQANSEISLSERTSLYEQIELNLFGLEGEFPIIPAFIRKSNFAVHDWLKITCLPGYSYSYYNWNIDEEMKNSSGLID